VLGSLHYCSRLHSRKGSIKLNRYLHATIADDVTAQLIALRLLIGVFEAGFYPTALFYLSTFYTRFDLAVRIALFYGQYAIAGAFSGAIGMCQKTLNFILANFYQHMVFSNSVAPYTTGSIFSFSRVA
jgi:MFS family permease